MVTSLLSQNQNVRQIKILPLTSLIITTNNLTLTFLFQFLVLLSVLIIVFGILGLCGNIFCIAVLSR